MTVHDLPPRWDGFTVEWAEQWEPLSASLSVHLDDLGACEECGSVAWRLTRFGRYWAVGLRLEHSPLTKPSRKINRLLASRCQDCDHTTITEVGTWQTWDIDPSDLTDAGSYDEATKQLTLF